jgi:hypothetical protein
VSRTTSRRRTALVARFSLHADHVVDAGGGAGLERRDRSATPG